MMIGRRQLLAATGAALALAPVGALALPDPPHPRMRRHYATSRFGQVHMRIAEPPAPPSAPPLLLFHQTPLSGRMYERIMPLLADRRRVFALDTPGYGESDRPETRPALATYSDALLEAVLPLSGPRLDVLGYHTGAAIAADMAARRDEVRRCVLIAFPLLDADARARLLGGYETQRQYDEAGSHLEEQWQGSLRARDPAQSLADVARIVAEKERPGLASGWGVQSAIEADLAGTLAAIARPTLVIAPGDGLYEETLATSMAVKGATFVEMPDIAYGLFDAHSERLARAILPFLDGPAN